MRTGTENKIVLTLIRHGSTPSNLEHRYLGVTDESLSDEGRAEIRECAKAARGEGFTDSQMIYCGPMARCMETRALLFGDREYKVISQLTEINFGDFEGKNYKELSGNPDYQAWIDSGGAIAFPNGESRQSFIDRSLEGYGAMLEDAKANNFTNISAVVHGGNIMAIISSMYGGEYFDYQVKPGKGYTCVVDLLDGYKIVDINGLE